VEAAPDVDRPASQAALFLDRDGTLVHPRHYPSHPEDLVLYAGLGPPLRRLQDAGFRLVVITNQSGLARGLFDEAALSSMHAHLTAALAQLGVRLDAIYHCPHHPEGIVPELAIRCQCRKPAPGMILQAAGALGVDVARSWFVGDILDDVEAGKRAGCRTVLVDLGTEAEPRDEMRRPDYVGRDTVHALQIVATLEGLGPATDLTYRPATWARRENDETGSAPCTSGLKNGGDDAGIR
jgi:D-glycero-D-manno-heptose 1,7-bisphosphate phosphatase